MALNKYVQETQSLLIMDEAECVMHAVNQMILHQAGVVLVAGEDSILKGILTERDVMTRVTAMEKDPYKTPLCDIMTKEVIALGESSTLVEAMDIMRERRIRYAPVIRHDGTIAGMLSMRNFLYDTMLTLVEEVKSLEAYFNDALGG